PRLDPGSAIAAGGVQSSEQTGDARRTTGPQAATVPTPRQRGAIRIRPTTRCSPRQEVTSRAAVSGLINRHQHVLDIHESIRGPGAPRLARRRARRPVVLPAVRYPVRIEVAVVSHPVTVRRPARVRPDVVLDSRGIGAVDHLVARAVRARCAQRRRRYVEEVPSTQRIPIAAERWTRTLFLLRAAPIAIDVRSRNREAAQRDVSR